MEAHIEAGIAGVEEKGDEEETWESENSNVDDGRQERGRERNESKSSKGEGGVREVPRL